MKVSVVIEAVSWENRTAKVGNEWAKVADNLNLKQLRVKKKHVLEVVDNLSGRKEIVKIYVIE